MPHVLLRRAAPLGVMRRDAMHACIRIRADLHVHACLHVCISRARCTSPLTPCFESCLWKSPTHAKRNRCAVTPGRRRKKLRMRATDRRPQQHRIRALSKALCSPLRHITSHLIGLTATPARENECWPPCCCAVRRTQRNIPIDSHLRVANVDDTLSARTRQGTPSRHMASKTWLYQDNEGEIHGQAKLELILGAMPSSC